MKMGEQLRRPDDMNAGRFRGRTFDRFCELQDLPADFLKDAPLTKEGKYRVVGNGVPLRMGRALARAIRDLTC